MTVSGKKFFGLAVATLVAICGWSCSKGGGSSTGSIKFGNADLLEIAAGRLVDVYGIGANNNTIGPVTLMDSVIGTDIQDGVRKVPRIRSLDPDKPNDINFDVEYSFEGVDPDTGQVKLVIKLPLYLDSTQDYGPPTSPEYLDALDVLDNNLKVLGSGFYGQDINVKPFSVCPRNGGIRLTFAKDLELPKDFFTQRDEFGQVVGFANTRAIQLLEIMSDPTDPETTGDFKIIPTRVANKGNVLVLDPVILGKEGPSYGVPTNADGLPASINSTGANIRIALPLGGAIRIPGLREQSDLLLGNDAYGVNSIIRDFRAANEKDNDPSISNGYVNDPISPKLVGECLISMLDCLPDNDPNSPYVYLKLWQGAMKHSQKYLSAKSNDEDYYSAVEIDLFDIIRQTILPKGPGQVRKVIQGEVVSIMEKIVHRDASNDIILDQFNQPWVEYMVKVRLEGSLPFEVNRDGNNDPVATDVVQVCTFESQTVREVSPTETEVFPKDDARYFLTFSPPAPAPQFPTDNISPFASVILRFTKPVDMGTLRALDTVMLSSQKTDPQTQSIYDTVLDPAKGTPGLIVSRIYDEDGAQRVVRSQPPLGFYHTQKSKWDPTGYRTGSGVPAPATDDLFYLYLLTGKKGVRDLSGNPIDLQGSTQEFFMVDFTIQADSGTNRVANVCRRFLAADEDAFNIDPTTSLSVKDWFGAVILLPGGYVMGRPSTRVTSYVDNMNQMPEPNDADYKFCPSNSTMTPTGSVMFGAPIQNPLNPLGCRLQTCWREIDLSLSRLNPFDFNLDVEQLWWAPFTGWPISWDTFDRTSLYLNHCEKRPSPCVSNGGSLPQYSNSGLLTSFKQNNLDASIPVTAYESVKLEIRESMVAYEPNDKIRYMPLPKCDTPYLTYRDERDLRLGGGSSEPVLSPYLSKAAGGNLANFNGSSAEGLPTIALPLLADFFFWPDDPTLNGTGNGFNGWQISLAIQSSPKPNFRVYSGGGHKPPGAPTGPVEKVDPSAETTARGGYNPSTGAKTASGDNSVYWIRVDFLKRISLMTYGFIDIYNPNKSADTQYSTGNDPRLGNFPMTYRPDLFDLTFEPPLSQMAQGTQISPQFRGAGWASTAGLMHPLAAGEAHVFNATSTYVKQCSAYYQSPNDLFDAGKLTDPKGTPMNPNSIRYFNWRLIFQNNVDIDPPVTPTIDSMGIVYRFKNQ